VGGRWGQKGGLGGIKGGTKSRARKGGKKVAHKDCVTRGLEAGGRRELE